MEPPAFPAGLATLRAAPGSPATLLLSKPAGTPPFTYHWSRAGASLDDRFTSSEDARGVTLTVSAARTGDSGVYTLQAINGAGKDTARVRMEVSPDEAPEGEDPPAFLRRLQDLTVKVGTRTRFLVEILSSTECRVTWYRNERRLMEAERIALARDGNFWCADVAAVSVDDAGRWTCTAENASGRASCSAHLNVLVPKAYKRPEFVEELRALLTEQGTVSLECKVVGVPTPVLRWFKDSREIKAGDVFALTANAEDPTSLGTYTCEAVNCMGRAYSSSKVHVVGRTGADGGRPGSGGLSPEPPPIFTKELEGQFVKISCPLTLSCQIVVPPWPRSVVWYNKEGKVEPSERYHVTEDGVGGHLLEVVVAEFQDEGEWKCVATSAGGRVGISTCYVTMDVPKNYRKPRFMENLQAVLTEEGLVSFECKVVGFPTPVLSWFKDGQELKPGDVYQLTGTNSLGSYCCIARNCMGQASSSAELTVEDIQNQLNEEEKLQLFSKNQAPKFVQGLKSVEAKIDEPFRFSIKVAIPPEPSVLWYRDDQPVDESTRCHLSKEERGGFGLDITNLEFLDQAEWKCVAMNDFGHSVTSCFLKLIIPRHYKKPRFLENLQAILSDEGAVNLECKVIGVPQPILKWYKDGEELKPGDIHRIISGQDGTCCLGTYTCEAKNCMGIAASSASLLGFEESMKQNAKKKAEEQALQRNLSLSTIHEERTSQMYDTPIGDITLDDKGEVSFSFDGKEVSVSLYETPDLTEEEALQIVEMYADQLSENVTEHNVVELPPLRFVKETSTSGNLLMEAIIIDVSPEYFTSPEEDLRTEADVEDISIAEENGLPHLSLDQDIGGENYLEKTMAMLTDEKADISKKLAKLKSESMKSGDDFFSLSRDPSLCEDKKDDDTAVISESELRSYESAHSISKAKSKSVAKTAESMQTVVQEPLGTIKAVVQSEGERQSQEIGTPVAKPKRERRSSRSSRRSSSGSEKSVSKAREELLQRRAEIETAPVLPLAMSQDEFKLKITDLCSSIGKVVTDVQIIERDIILKSELMSSAATASRSLEIISSLITPLSEIHSIFEASKDAVSESKTLSSSLFSSLPQSLKTLQQSLTIIEKCIDVESESKTLVKKTCVAFIETCGIELQKLMSVLNTLVKANYLVLEEKTCNELDVLTNDINHVVSFTTETINTRQMISGAKEVKIEEPSLEANHLRETQKAVFELKSPLSSLLCIAESAKSNQIIDISNIKSNEVILTDMSASIQDLQSALEQIELLSVKESTIPVKKYNTEIIESVVESVLKLRSSFEQLSSESKIEDDKSVLMEALSSIKQNLNELSLQITTIENNVGTFDILQSDNKLEVLQKMAQILIALETNIPRLEQIPEIKTHMDIFHKNLTKVLENVIESNEAKKYFALIEICDVVNRVNTAIKNIDTDTTLSLASLCNTMKIIKDHFVKNIFEAELNCTILGNIADVYVGLQEALTHAEEMSVTIDSEHFEDITSQSIKETKAKVTVEHINQTIVAIHNVKMAESVGVMKSNLSPVFEKISPILEELRQSIASVEANALLEEGEHTFDLSESFVKKVATSVCDLHENITVLNCIVSENVENLKDNSEISTTIAKPLQELRFTLETLQQDVISQCKDISLQEVSENIANAVQDLQSCILMIEQHAQAECVDELSTLEDVSGIKTTAETIPSDRLVLPSIEEPSVQSSIEPVLQPEMPLASAVALQSLNKHITVLQNQDVMDALDTLSEVSDYSSLKSVALGLGDLHSGIEQFLHPLVMEDAIELKSTVNASKLSVIADPMQDLQQSLSILDTTNIPIYEHILEMSAEKIHSVFQSLFRFKEQLDKCIKTVFPAMETADKTIEISNKVEALRLVCENLKDIIDNTKLVSSEALVSENIVTLEKSINNLLDATDVSKGIKIELVKSITEELFAKVSTIQEEIIRFTPQTAENLAQEAKFIQTIEEIENNIAVLEQYDFVDLSLASELTSCASPHLAFEFEATSLLQMSDVVENAVNVLHDSVLARSEADIMIVDDFFKTCKNEFTILKVLLSKNISHKKIIRLLQEFAFLQQTISDFRLIKRRELNLPDEINEYVSDFLTNADEHLKNIQVSLSKVVESQSDLLFLQPSIKLDEATISLKEIKSKKQLEPMLDVIIGLSKIISSAKPSIQSLKEVVLKEINGTSQETETFNNSLIEKMEDFEILVQETALYSLNEKSNEIVTELQSCIQKHSDYKDATGSGKVLIILKCLTECIDILEKQSLTPSKPSQITIIEQKAEDSSLKLILNEMITPLQTLQNELTFVQKQILSGVDEDAISVDMPSTESVTQTMANICKEISLIEDQYVSVGRIFDKEDIDLVREMDKEIQSIQEGFKAIENIPAAKVVLQALKPVEQIEKTLSSILSCELDNKKGRLSKEKSTELLQHIDQYIELTTIVQEISAIIREEELKESVNIARELKESIAASEDINLEAGGEVSSEVRTEQARLAQQLHEALSTLQVHAIEKANEIGQPVTEETLMRITETASQLQTKLVAVVSIDSANIEMIHFPEDIKIHTDDHQVIERQTTISLEEESQEAAVITKTLAESTVLKEEAVLETKDEEKNDRCATIEISTELLHQRIEELLTDDLLETVTKLAVSTSGAHLIKSIEVAKKLRENIAVLHTITDTIEAQSLIEETRATQVDLKQEIQESILSLKNIALENVKEIDSTIKTEDVSKLINIMKHLQEDLVTPVSSRVQNLELFLSGQSTPELSMKDLSNLLNEVNVMINLSPTEQISENMSGLVDILDEVQTVLIKLKCDYDGSVNDTLNETLEDLECSVRSFQLQISQESPPTMLKEACVTLQLLINNMSEVYESIKYQMPIKIVDKEELINKCVEENTKSLELIGLASNIETDASGHLDNIVSGLGNLKENMKLLKSSFTGNAETVIENGIDTIQHLNQIEDKVFSLEREVEDVKIVSTAVRDSVIAAIHSVYGSISNMRCTISSIQKWYMHENYGIPSENILHSIKNAYFITNQDISDIEKVSWKNLSKSLRTVFNHFEDIKFYINLDKTARLPSDATFTKIILDEFKNNITQCVSVLSPRQQLQYVEDIENILSTINNIQDEIKTRTTLEVKEKMPMFKKIAALILVLTKNIKNDKAIEKLLQPEENNLRNAVPGKVTANITDEITVALKPEIFYTDEELLEPPTYEQNLTDLKTLQFKSEISELTETNITEEPEIKKSETNDVNNEESYHEETNYQFADNIQTHPLEEQFKSQAPLEKESDDEAEKHRLDEACAVASTSEEVKTKSLEESSGELLEIIVKSLKAEDNQICTQESSFVPETQEKHEVEPTLGVINKEYKSTNIVVEEEFSTNEQHAVEIKMEPVNTILEEELVPSNIEEKTKETIQEDTFKIEQQSVDLGMITSEENQDNLSSEFNKGTKIEKEENIDFEHQTIGAETATQAKSASDELIEGLTTNDEKTIYNAGPSVEIEIAIGIEKQKEEVSLETKEDTKNTQITLEEGEGGAASKGIEENATENEIAIDTEKDDASADNKHTEQDQVAPKKNFNEETIAAAEKQREKQIDKENGAAEMKLIEEKEKAAKVQSSTKVQECETDIKLIEDEDPTATQLKLIEEEKVAAKTKCIKGEKVIEGEKAEEKAKHEEKRIETEEKAVAGKISTEEEEMATAENKLIKEDKKAATERKHIEQEKAVTEQMRIEEEEVDATKRIEVEEKAVLENIRIEEEEIAAAEKKRIDEEEMATAENKLVKEEEIAATEKKRIEEGNAATEKIRIEEEEMPTSEKKRIEIEEKAVAEMESVNMEEVDAIAMQRIEAEEKAAVAEKIRIEEEEIAVAEKKWIEEEEIAATEKKRIQKEQAAAEKNRIEEEEVGAAENKRIQEEELAASEKKHIGEEKAAAEKERIEDEEIAEAEKKRIEMEETAMAERIDIEEEKIAAAEKKRIEEVEMATAENKRTKEEEIAAGEKKRIEEEAMAAAEKKWIEEEEMAATEKKLIEMEKVAAEKKRIEEEEMAESEKKRIEEEEIATAEKKRIETEETVMAERIRIEEKAIAAAEKKSIEEEEMAATEKKLIEMEKVAAVKKRIEEEEVGAAENKRIQEEELAASEKKRIGEEKAAAEKERIEDEEIAAAEKKRIEMEETVMAERIGIEEEKIAAAEKKRIEEVEIATAENKRTKEEEIAAAEKKRIEEEAMAAAEKKWIEEEEMAATEKKLIEMEKVAAEKKRIEEEEMAESEKKRIEEEEIATAEKKRIETEETVMAERIRIEEKAIAAAEKKSIEEEEMAATEKKLIEMEKVAAVKKRIEEEEVGAAENKRIQEEELAASEKKRIGEEKAAAEKERIEDEEIAAAEKKRIEMEETVMAERIGIEEEKIAAAEKKRIEEVEIATAENKRTKEEEIAAAEKKRIEEEAMAAAEKKSIEEEEMAATEKKLIEMEKVAAEKKRIEEEEMADSEKKRIEEEAKAAAEKKRIEMEETAMAERIQIEEEEMATAKNKRTKEEKIAAAEKKRIEMDEVAAEKKRIKEEKTAESEKKRIEEEEIATAEKKRIETEETAMAERIRIEEEAMAAAENKRTQEEEIAATEKKRIKMEEVATEKKRIEEEAMAVAEKNRIETEKVVAKKKRIKVEEMAVSEKKRIEEEEIAAAEEKRIEEEERDAAESKRIEEEDMAASEKKRLETEEKAVAEKKRIEEEEMAASEKKRIEEEEIAAAEKKRIEEEEKAAAESKRIKEEEIAATEKKRIEEEKIAAAEKKRIETEEKAMAEKKRIEEEMAASEKKRIEEEKIAAAEKKRIEEEEKAAAESKRIKEEEIAASEKKRIEEEKAAAEKKRIEDEEIAAAEKKRIEMEETAMAERIRIEEEKIAAAEKKRIETEEKAVADKKRIEEEEMAASEKKRNEKKKAAAEKKRIEDEEIAAAEKKRIEMEETAMAERIRIEEEKIAAAEKKRIETEEKAVAEKKRIEEEMVAAESKRIEEEEMAASEKKRIEEEKIAAAEKKRIETEEKAMAEKKRIEEEMAASEKKRIEEEKIAAAEKIRVEEEERAAAESKRIEEEEMAASEKKRIEEEKIAAAEKKRIETEEKAMAEKKRIEEEMAASEKKRIEEEKIAAAEKKRIEEEEKAAAESKRIKEEEIAATEKKRNEKKKAAAEKKRIEEEEMAANEKKRIEKEAMGAAEKKRIEAEEMAVAEKKRTEAAAIDVTEEKAVDAHTRVEKEPAKSNKEEKPEPKQMENEKAYAEQKRIIEEEAAAETKRGKIEEKAAADKRRIKKEKAVSEKNTLLKKNPVPIEEDSAVRKKKQTNVDKDKAGPECKDRETEKLLRTQEKISKELQVSEEPKSNGEIKDISRKGIPQVEALHGTYTSEQYIENKSKEEVKPRFIDRNHKDYTMEFERPSNYREREFNTDDSRFENFGKNITIYKAQTILLDSQLRSSVPPQVEFTKSFESVERRTDMRRSKAQSEARSVMSDKRSTMSRDSKRKPVFSTYLTDRTAVEGSRVKLTCSVLSSSDPKIKWYKNGAPLDNKLKYRTKYVDGLITMEVLNAVPSDSAEYCVNVENDNGTVSSSAILKVYPSFEASPIPPTFTRSIRDTYHLAENELVLECRIRGQPLPTISWLKDDKPIELNERFQAYYLADGVCRLAICHPTIDDSGKYTCKAENSIWSDQIMHIVNFTGREHRLGPNLATIEKSRFNRNAIESRRPHFTNVLTDYKVAKGGTIGLQVEIRGSPTKVEWLREGREVSQVYRNAKTFVEQGLYTLALSDVTEKETGMYTCRAWGHYGNVDMNAAITVVQPNELDGKPAIIVGRPEKDILISVGEDVNISFRVQGEPKPKVVFMKGTRDITNSQRVCKMSSDDYVKFTLKRSGVSDAGTYCILARNAYGCDRAFVTVVVRQRASSENLISDWTYPIDEPSSSIASRGYKSVPDRIPGEPSVSDGGNNWVTLTWVKPDPSVAAPVLAYKVEGWLLGKDGGARWHELGVTPLNAFDAFNLKQGEQYHFRVTPKNRFGWGESSQTSKPVSVGVAGDRPEFVDILPGQLKVLVGETANLRCTVRGKPLPEVVWMKNGHEVEEEDQRVTMSSDGSVCCLVIKDINEEDEARYSCEATNENGRASTYARLAVVTDRQIWEADAKLKRERSSEVLGEYPPQFTMRLRDRRVQATYPVRLTCQVVGNPSPKVTWFKDGQSVNIDSRRTESQDEHFHTLEIAPTQLEDGGVYEAMARNSCGAVSCRCSLVVDKGIRAYVAPEFCCGLEPLYRVHEGEELRISAVVEAYPSVGVTWFRDGVRLRPSRRAIMTLDRDGQIELALAFVTVRDAGVYSCTASNEVGLATTSGKMEVIGDGRLVDKKSSPPMLVSPDVPYSKEPMFIRKPRSSEAREGDTVIIQCEVVGDPKPDVYWLRDFLKPDYYRDAAHFKRVGSGSEYRFEIPHAKLDYTGTYSVVAKNVHGEAKAIISLQILAKDPSASEDSHNVRYGRVEVLPRFTRELTDLLCHDGDAVEFECRVTGEPAPDIRWFHYQQLIRDCEDWETSFEEGTARLRIKQVTAEDEGNYCCSASNDLGKASSSACLVVYPPGEPNTLSRCLRRPRALSTASTPRSTPARSMSRATTPAPAQERRVHSPSRQTAPKFYTYPPNKVVDEGEPVKFQCAVQGLPSPWGTWDKDGVIITPSARISIKEKDERRILEIEEVSIEDVGLYRITIENDYGRVEASARLEVISQKGKFYAGVREYSASPRRGLGYRRRSSISRQD